MSRAVGIAAIVYLLGWFAALAFAAWMLHGHGHDGWAVAVPLIGVLAVSVKGVES